MGKQSMGTPSHNYGHRTDNKLYRLQTGQTPIVRPKLHDEYAMDNFPNGMNAVVCVISYTGYDMEDAMIINKSSYERGFGYGTVYKSEFIDLSDRRVRGQPITCHFGLIPDKGGRRLPKAEFEELSNFLGLDGLPNVGIKLKDGDPLYAYIDESVGQVKVVKYKSLEEAWVDEVRVLGMCPTKIWILSKTLILLASQETTTEPKKFKRSISSTAFLVHPSLATSSHPATDRKVFALKSGPQQTCRFPNPESSPMSSSIRTPSPPE